MRRVFPYSRGVNGLADQAVFSKRCYPRVPLPVGGCKAALLQYETWALRRTYVALFALVPAHLINMIIALLCANHVTECAFPLPLRDALCLTPARQHVRAGSHAHEPSHHVRRRLP